MRRTDEGTLIALRAFGQGIFKLLLGEDDLLLELSTLGLDCQCGPDGNLACFHRIKNGNARGLKAYQILNNGIGRIIGPVGKSQHDLIVGGNDGDVPCLAVFQHIAVDALLVNHNRIHNSGAYHLSPPAHGSGDLGLGSQIGRDLGWPAGLGNPGEINGCAAYAANIDLIPEVIVLSVDHSFGACCQIVAVGYENCFVLIQGAHADLYQWGIGCTTWHVIGHCLQHVADLFAQGVDHAAMQGFRFKVLIETFLAGVGGSQKLNYLLLAVLQCFTEVLQGLGLDSKNSAGKGRVHQNLAAHIELHVPEFIQAPVVQVSAVSSMGAGSHEDCNQYNFAAGAGHINAAGTLLVAGQIARPIGTERACIIRRRVHDLVPVADLEVPVTERSYIGFGEGAHRLVPFILFLNDSAYVDLDVLHVLNRETALSCCHRNLSLLFL
ncbi:MAG: hypothetical protein A4E49_02673 [Methanosaeta sp. PtaU1.Bin112]|nr:MAG: hypothetical protein A4E49_02673 [Methanosaeta sp. PtaU1.Bin112]